MEALSEKKTVEAGMEVDVFAVSAALVGVCLTVIQLIQMNTNQKLTTVVDEILAVDAILFLAACFCSYVALCVKGRSARRKIFERTAHGAFLAALSIIVVVCALMAYSFF